MDAHAEWCQETVSQALSAPGAADPKCAAGESGRRVSRVNVGSRAYFAPDTAAPKDLTPPDRSRYNGASSLPSETRPPPEYDSEAAGGLEDSKRRGFERRPRAR